MLYRGGWFVKSVLSCRGLLAFTPVFPESSKPNVSLWRRRRATGLRLGCRFLEPLRVTRGLDQLAEVWNCGERRGNATWHLERTWHGSDCSKLRSAWDPTFGQFREAPFGGAKAVTGDRPHRSTPHLYLSHERFAASLDLGVSPDYARELPVYWRST